MIFCNLFVKNKEIYSILINLNIFKDTLHKECRSIRRSESTEKRYNTHKQNLYQSEIYKKNYRFNEKRNSLHKTTHLCFIYIEVNTIDK